MTSHCYMNHILCDHSDAPKLVGTALGDRAALLWSEVVSTDEENPVINYIVYPSDGSLPIILPPTARHHNMFNLTKGETYTVKVAAKSGLGEGQKATFTFSTCKSASKHTKSCIL